METVNISNAICKALKSKLEKTPEVLFGIQLGILGMFKLQHEKKSCEDSELEVTITPDDILESGIGLPFTTESLITHINDGYLARNWAMSISGERVRLINYAHYNENKGEISISFNARYKCLLIPSRDKSIFNLEHLYRFEDTVTLLLYLYVCSLWNTAEHTDSGIIRHIVGYNDLRQILGYEPINDGRTRCNVFCKQNLKKAMVNIHKAYPEAKIQYIKNFTGQNHKINTLTLEISGIKTEGILGAEELEVINNNIPGFAGDNESLFAFLDSCLFQDKSDSFFPDRASSTRKAEVNCVYIRDESIVSTGRLRCINRLVPDGYQPILMDTKEYLYHRVHLVARRLGGGDTLSNVIAGTISLNAQMTLIENQIAKYVQEHHGHVLYRVTPLYYGQEIMCRKVQIEAYSLDDSGKSVCINVKLLNAQKGYRINYTTGEAIKVG